MKILKIFGIVSLLVLTASCSSNSPYEPDAVGYGSDPVEMKISPCACLELENKPGLPAWFIS